MQAITITFSLTHIAPKKYHIFKNAIIINDFKKNGDKAY